MLLYNGYWLIGALMGFNAHYNKIGVLYILCFISALLFFREIVFYNSVLINNVYWAFESAFIFGYLVSKWVKSDL